MKRTGTKRLAAASLALALAFALPMQAFADTWDLEKGDITISATTTEQTVTQNDTSKEDANPVITSSSTTGNTITVETTGNAVAQFTIKDVDIDTSKEGKDGNTGGPAIEIGDSKAEITISGDNRLESKDNAAIHVSGGDLTIRGNSDNDKVTAIGDTASAGIGSEVGENLSGSITIESGTVTAESLGYGAGIGTGINGKLSGSINISGGDVTGTSDFNGAGIGTGQNGKLSGSINITGGDVKGISNGNGAGIGTGNTNDDDLNGELSGSINISGGDVTGTSAEDGAGIGTGSDGKLSGSISISSSDTDIIKGESKGDGAGIGTGTSGGLSGSINISGGDVTGTSGEDGTDTGNGAGIGTGSGGELSGSINISDGDVKGSSEGQGADIGTGNGGNIDEEGTIRIIEDATVTVDSIGAGQNGSSNGKYYNSDSTDLTAITVGEYELTDKKDASCTEAGYKTYTYTDDDSNVIDSYTVSIPATGHTYEAVVTPATAGHQGYTTYTCSCCNTSYISDYTTALPVEESSDDNGGGTEDSSSGTGDSGTSDNNGSSTAVNPVVPDNTDNNGTTSGTTSTGAEINAMPIDDINDNGTYATEIIWNQHDDVSAAVPVGTGGYLHESEISEEAYAQIIADVTGEVVCTAHLAYSSDDEPHSYELTFHLDTVYAGRTIRVYLLTDNGERKTWTVTADANGGVTFTTSDLGSFVLAVID